MADALDFVVDNRGKTVPTTEKGFPLIATNCISNDNLYPSFLNVRYISTDTYNNWFRSHPLPDDIIITNKGSQNGAVCFVPNPVTFCIAQDMVALRAKRDLIYPKFLFAALRSQEVQNQIKNLNVDGVIPHFKKTDFNKLKLPNPCYKNQKIIGDFYFNFCEKINLNNQINQTLESIAQALFKSWFIDFEPVRAKIAARQEGNDPELAAMCAISGKSEAELEQMAKEDFAELQATAALFPDELVESELGEVPRGWGLQSLYDTAEFVNGAAFKAKDFSSNTNEGLPIIKIAELKQGVSAQTKYTNLSFDQKYKVRSGDIFYSWSGSPETSLDVFKWFGGDGWLNQHIFKINTKNKGQTYFVYYLMKYLKPILIRLATNKQTTGLGHITVADMKSLQVIKPEENLFLSYAKIVAPFYEKESLLKQEIINLAMLRDTLLPKLLSGEMDVSDLQGEGD